MDVVGVNERITGAAEDHVTRHLNSAQNIN